ncbi:hypothetical protein C8J56DRAFT_930668 [Mycena floridula]|nr:hypothetical protein C8J56DRAFT_930668 [Mycena floridula]
MWHMILASYRLDVLLPTRMSSSQSWDIGTSFHSATNCPDGLQGPCIHRPDQHNRNELRKVAGEASNRLQKYLLQQQIAQTQESIALLKDEITHQEAVMQYEVVDRLIQNYNDRIQDVYHLIKDNGPQTLLDASGKKKLKDAGLGYITRLLHPPSNLPEDLTALIQTALTCITPTERPIIMELLKKRKQLWEYRNTLQHPNPTVTEAVNHIFTLFKGQHQIGTTLAAMVVDAQRPLRRLPSSHDIKEPEELFTTSLKPVRLNLTLQSKVQRLELMQRRLADGEALAKSIGI